MSRLRRHITLSCGSALVVFITVLVLGFGSRENWLFDLMANFRVHSILGLLFAAMFLSLLRSKSLGVVVVALAAAGFGGILIVEAKRVTSGSSDDSTFVIVSTNVGHMDRDGAKLIDLFEGGSADFIVLQEYQPRHHQHLEEITHVYPFRAAFPAAGSFGIALYSRHRIERSDLVYFEDSDIPYIRARIEADGDAFELVAVHLEWPVYPTSFFRRNEQIRQLGGLAADSDAAIIICGDWNLTPWSGWYDYLLDSGFSDGGRFTRTRATWPAAFSRFGIPIDHCFTAGSASIFGKSTGDTLGSDHLPIEVEFSVDTKRRIPGDNGDPGISARRPYSR